MRSFIRLLLSSIGLALLGAGASAQEIPESLLKVAPIPEWAEVYEVDLSQEVPSDDISDGEYFWNVELQWHIPSKTRLYRSVVEIVTESGLEGNGEWTFTFDPEYETQRIHWTRIIRDGEVIYDYDPSTLRLYSTETDMASRMLNGSLTSLIILEDLRVGDIVDMSWSLEGTNPAFGDHAVLRRSINWSVPIRRQFTRILAETDQPLITKAFLEDQPVVSTNEDLGLKEWRHQLIDSPPIRSEGSVPAKIRVYGSLHASSFANWAEVADWAVGLYPIKGSLPEELKEEAEAIMARSKSPKERTIEALYYVQGNIRYLGLEMGHGAYQPREPELVWKRRFGDCKDKTLLLVRMLREMDIEAHPALVNTGWEAGIVNFLPSPIAFDHVIVTAEIDGTRYWLDPTYDRQFGPLDKLPVDNYGYALLIREGETDLTTVTEHPKYENFIQVETKFDVGRPGEETTMEVTTRYGGRTAANARSYFENTSLNEIGQSYTDYWAGDYPHPELVSPVEYAEFPSVGEVEIKEIYRIPDAWEPSGDEEDPNLYFTFTPATLNDYLVFPERIKRRFPFEVGAPVSIHDNFEVYLFEPWDFSDDNDTIQGPGVEYTSKTSWGSIVRSKFHLDMKDRVIDAKDVLEFESKMRKIQDEIGWELSWDPTFVEGQAAGDSAGPFENFDNIQAYTLYGAGILLTLPVFLPFLFKRRLNPPKLIPPGTAEYEGVQGWLFLPIIGLVITPPLMLAQIFGEDLIWMFDKEQWNSVTDTVSAEMIQLIGFESVFNGFILVAPIILLIMMLQKRWFLPALMIGFYVVNVIFLAIDHTLYGMLKTEDLPANDPSELIKGIGTVCIWGTYFAVSKRVKATFRS